MKVYIGGIGVESNWRTEFDALTQSASLEIKEGNPNDKAECDYLLYVITPKMKNVDAIVNVVNDSNVQKGRTIFCTIDSEGESHFTSHQEKSLVATGKMVELNGGKYFKGLKNTVNYITGAAN
jgi:hypothetical protein